MSPEEPKITLDPEFERALKTLFDRRVISRIQAPYVRAFASREIQHRDQAENKKDTATLVYSMAHSSGNPELPAKETSLYSTDATSAVRNICRKICKQVTEYRERCAAEQTDPGPLVLTFPDPKWIPVVTLNSSGAPSLRPEQQTKAVLSAEERGKFQQLFGCPPEQADKGLIVIQADACEPILSHLKLVREILAQRKEEHLKDPDPDPGPVEKGKFDPRRVPEAVEIPPPSRLFKARFWINKWDIDGAIAIAEAFQKWGRPPKLDLRSHKPSGGRPQHTDAPFEIAMGLGFTDPTAESIRECNNWMFKAVWWDCGDAVALHKDFVPRSAKKFLNILEAGKKHRDFKRILPRGWRSNTSGGADGIDHMSEWISENSVEDYAIVFRGVTHGQVHWVLAGFTENGTAAAGHFLGNKWATDIWDCAYPRHVRESFPEEFLVVIHGPSDRPEEWEPVKALTITPAKLHSRGWSKRNGKWIKSGKSKKRVTKRSGRVT